MPSLENHPVSKRTKLLLCGDSGSGKTAALASLANAGYKLRIFDFDDGLDVLSALVKPDKMQNVHYVTLKDHRTNAGAFRNFVNMLENWKEDGGASLGGVNSWGEDVVVAIDTITFMGQAALHDSLKRAGKKLTDQPSQPDWGDAMRNVEGMIDYLTSDNVKCNLVCTAHLQYYEDGNGVRAKQYPNIIGNKLAPKMGRYFNSVVRIDVKGSGTNVNRVFRTASDTKMDLKVARVDVPVEVDADLAKLFAMVQGSANTKKD